MPVRENDGFEIINAFLEIHIDSHVKIDYNIPVSKGLQKGCAQLL